MSNYNVTPQEWAAVAYSTAQTILVVYSGEVEYAFSDTTPTIDHGHPLSAGKSVVFTQADFTAWGTTLWVRSVKPGSVLSINGNSLPPAGVYTADSTLVTADSTSIYVG